MTLQFNAAKESHLSYFEISCPQHHVLNMRMVPIIQHIHAYFAKKEYDSDLTLSITNTVLAGCEFTPSSTGDIYYVFQMALTIDSPKITGGEEIV